MNDKLGFDETELNFILEAITRFRQDIDMWGYVVPQGKGQADLTREYQAALKSIRDRIVTHLDGGGDV